MSNLDNYTSSEGDSSAESMKRGSSISVLASTQEVSDVDYESDSDSSTTTALERKFSWPIWENLEDYPTWWRLMKDLIKNKGKKGILQELKNNHKLILPEEAKLVVKNCKTLDQMFKLLSHRFFIYEEGWSNQLNNLTKNTFLPDNYEIGMYMIRL